MAAATTTQQHHRQLAKANCQANSEGEAQDLLRQTLTYLCLTKILIPGPYTLCALVRGSQHMSLELMMLNSFIMYGSYRPTAV